MSNVLVFLILVAVILVLIILLVLQRAREPKLDVQEYRKGNKTKVHKNIIDNLHGHHPEPTRVNDSQEAYSLHDDVRAHLRANQKIQAIKLVRDRLGLGLLEAKNWVENVEREMK